MDDLIAFLNARLDEDEAAIEAPESWSEFDETHGCRRVDVDHSFERVVACTRSWRGVYIARYDPARTLREVAAKRTAIEEYQAVLEDVDNRDGREFDDAGYGRAMVSSLRGVLKAMAAVYSDHPEYQKEWTP